jgi:hypothetical protein
MEIDKLNASIRHIGMPLRMTRLPINERGYPVPWFVAMINGKWDFRAISPGRIAEAFHRRKCWLCGEPLGQYLAFTIGPMCSVNRINSEPPSHLECAQYAVRACPFLSHPNMRRNEVDPPGGTVAGEHLAHNPGAIAIWVTKSYKPMKVDEDGGVLFQLGDPTAVHWFHEGRKATRGEVLEAMYKGLPELEKRAPTKSAKEALTAMVDRALKYIPPEDPSDARSVRHEEQPRQVLRDSGEDAAKDGSASPG